MEIIKINDYKALRIFLLAAEKRNFAQVARELNLAPAAITRAISTLEDDLGIQLFVRTTRQVSLTTDGAIFAAQVQPAMPALETARKDVIDAHKADQGRLRISVPTWFGNSMCLPSWRRCSKPRKLMGSQPSFSGGHHLNVGRVPPPSSDLLPFEAANAVEDIPL